ncbi:MAG: hypothetical protein ACHQ9S_22525 [Candidatus Binatia bacterium]
MHNLLKDRHVELDQSEVFRMMGYPHAASVSQPVLDLCREQIRRVVDCAAPWGSYREMRIKTITRDRVQLDSGGVLRSRRVASILRRAQHLEVCLVTLGSQVTAEISRLMAENCVVEALAFDAAATVATNALMAQLRERICAEVTERNCGTTHHYGPGYTGWDIQDLPILFSCLETEDLPVRLNQQLMMIPEKSLLGVVGIVPGGRRLRQVAPCRLCDLERCSVRRAS